MPRLSTLRRIRARGIKNTMLPESGKEPEIFSEFRELLPNSLSLGKLSRYEFYEACRQSNIKVAIATGEQRTFANILITIGVAGP